MCRDLVCVCSTSLAELLLVMIMQAVRIASGFHSPFAAVRSLTGGDEDDSDLGILPDELDSADLGSSGQEEEEDSDEEGGPRGFDDDGDSEEEGMSGGCACDVLLHFKKRALAAMLK